MQSKSDGLKGFFQTSLVFMGCAMINIGIAQESVVSSNKNADKKQETLGKAYSRETGLIPLSGRITFFRPALGDAKDTSSIEINGDYHATLQNGGYSDLCLNAKHVVLNLQTILPNGDKSVMSAMEADLRPGDDLYVRVEPQGGRARMELVSSEAAQAELLETRRQMHTLSRVQGAVACALVAQKVPVQNVAKNTTETSEVAQKNAIFYESINNLFQFNRADMGGLLGKGMQELTQAIEKLKLQLANSSKAKVEVIGYSDFIGNPAQKQKIALERANTVRMFAIKNGISAEKISSQGRSDTEPVVGQCTNVRNIRNIQCNQANRRVVVQVVAQ